MSLKTTASVAAVAALIIAAPAAGALADNPGQGQSGTHANHGHSRMHFEANGTVVSVDTTGDTLTFHAKGGSRDLRGTDVTVSVTATTSIRRNGSSAQLSDVQVGDRVAVEGARSDTGLTARHVNAHGPSSTDTSSTGTSSTGTSSTGTSSTDTSGTAA